MEKDACDFLFLRKKKKLRLCSWFDKKKKKDCSYLWSFYHVINWNIGTLLLLTPSISLLSVNINALFPRRNNWMIMCDMYSFKYVFLINCLLIVLDSFLLHELIANIFKICSLDTEAENPRGQTKCKPRVERWFDSFCYWSKSPC